MYNVSIPKISKEELIDRYKRIKPIVTIDGVKYFLREFNERELRNISYIWKKEEDKREKVDMDMYVERQDLDFECLHRYGYYGLFKPSIAEVLSQISELDVTFVDAFEIIESPETCADFKRNPVAFDQGFHSSTVRLYTKKNPRVTFR